MYWYKQGTKIWTKNTYFTAWSIFCCTQYSRLYQKEELHCLELKEQALVAQHIGQFHCVLKLAWLAKEILEEASKNWQVTIVCVCALLLDEHKFLGDFLESTGHHRDPNVRQTCCLLYTHQNRNVCLLCTFQQGLAKKISEIWLMALDDNFV